MEIKRSGSQPSGKGPAEYFTGSVSVDSLFQAPAPARVVSATVTFEPGARTAWHTHPLGQTLIVTAGPRPQPRPGARTAWPLHPLGQTLIVTAGSGRIQRWGDPIQEIRTGYVGWISPAEKQ